jgi:hypothetical protein
MNKTKLPPRTSSGSAGDRALEIPRTRFPHWLVRMGIKAANGQLCHIIDHCSPNGATPLDAAVTQPGAKLVRATGQSPRQHGLRLVLIAFCAISLSGCSPPSATHDKDKVADRSEVETPVSRPNEAVTAFRAKFPSDTRSDDEITAILGTRFPGKFDGHAGFLDDFTRVQASGEIQYQLGMRYAKGQGVKPDYEAALEWFQKAAAQGYAEAHLAIGGLYDEGMGVPQDYNEAQKQYLKAAELGDARGFMYVGTLHENGNGVPQDYQAAMNLYRKAADLGVAEANFRIGSLYSDGNGVPKSMEECMRWWIKAADRGDMVAQLMLCVYYTGGNHVPLDLIEAHKWYNIMAANGRADAGQLRDSLERQMTREQITEAQKRALEWKKK